MPKDDALETLPRWDLSDLYSGPRSPELERDLAAVTEQAKAFQQRLAGQVATLDGMLLGAAVAEYEAMEQTLGRIMSYAHLYFAGDMEDPEVGKFYQTIQERVNAITVDLLFFTLEINRLDDDALERRFAESDDLARYRPWLRDIRVFRPYQLSDELEKLLHEKSISGRGAWVRLFDETMTALRFPFDGRMLSSEEVLHLLSDKDAAVRKRAARSLSGVFRDNVRLFAHVTNTLAKDKEIEDRWRGLPFPAAARHLGNHVEPEVVDALITAVKDAYPRLSHRYYAMKAKWLSGKEDARIDWWDRNAPLPEDTDGLIPWQEARDIVLGAYRRFSPKLADLGQRFFDNPWIDAPVRPGKASGAFAHPTVPDVHPYLLLNYQGKVRDVMTLAHELGHGVHQLLAAGQGALMADTPLTLAETASVFGEQLTFRALLEGEKDPSRRRVMLAGKVEDMLNTVVRQTAFYEFERIVHDERRESELTPNRLGEIWLRTQSESLGPTFRFDDDYRNFWCYIPHFIHSPFYVYAYAFGDCLVNALYAVYQETGQGFQEKYFEMLRAGGTLRHRELLAPFGLDAGNPAFWSKGLGVIEGFIDELAEI